MNVNGERIVITDTLLATRPAETVIDLNIDGRRERVPYENEGECTRDWELIKKAAG